MKKEEKKKNWWRAGLLTFAIVACISIPLILYFTIGQRNNNTPVQSGEINLDQETITYHANVKYMNNIRDNEPTTIKNGIETNITNKMNNWQLEINVDYTINNLDSIQNGADLNNIHIVVASVATSTKVKGSLVIHLTVTEDMTDRSINPITIPVSEEDGLSDLIAAIKVDEIKNNISAVLATGQDNVFGIDFDIVNLNLIKPGAKFADYQNALSVVPISTSTHLTGSFSFTFVLYP